MKRLCKALLCLLIISLVVTAGAFSVLVYHHSMIALYSNTLAQHLPFLLDFEQEERAYPYAEALKNDEFKPYSVFDMIPGQGLGGFEPPQKWIVATITVHYYSEPTETEPVFTVEKGDIIYCSFPTVINSDRADRYRGLSSLPSLKQGWRIAKPFMVDGEESNSSFLYVKTNDLADVFRGGFIDESSDSFSSFPEKIWMTYAYPKLYLFTTDRLLYTDGSFLSPDLVALVYPPAPFISLGVSVILLAAYLVVRRKAKIQNKTV